MKKLLWRDLRGARAKSVGCIWQQGKSQDSLLQSCRRNLFTVVSFTSALCMGTAWWLSCETEELRGHYWHVQPWLRKHTCVGNRTRYQKRVTLQIKWPSASCSSRDHQAEWPCRRSALNSAQRSSSLGKPLGPHKKKDGAFLMLYSAFPHWWTSGKMKAIPKGRVCRKPGSFQLKKLPSMDSPSTQTSLITV